jgi:hypothetical protein
MKRYLHPICCLAALMVTASARANWGGGEDGNAATGSLQPLAAVEDTFRPAGLAQVEMQSEFLQIHLHDEGAYVEIDYTLHNPGDQPVTVTAGFPTFSQQVMAELIPRPGPRRDPYDVSDYHLIVDGKETPWKLESQPKPLKREDGIGAPGNFRPETPYSTPAPFWFVSSVPFGAGQTRAVHIWYWAQYRNGDGGTDGFSTTEPTTLAYQLSTAAGWKGPINKGRVIITADAVDAGEIKIRPAGRFQRAGNTFTWEFTDLKPTQADDITVRVRDGYERYATCMAISKDRPEGTTAEDHSIGDYRVHADGTSYWVHQRFHATATSILDPQKYGAQNVGVSEYGYTGNPWAEGVPGDGIGEGLDLTLDWPCKVCEIGIVNGFDKYGVSNARELYQENNRVAGLSVSINGGKEFDVPVPDEFLQNINPEPYWFPVHSPDEPVKTIRLRIKQVYHGTKYQDTCISKIFLKTKLAREPKILPLK